MAVFIQTQVFMTVPKNFFPLMLYSRTFSFPLFLFPSIPLSLPPSLPPSHPYLNSLPAYPSPTCGAILVIPVEDSPLSNAHLLILCNISNLSLQRSFCPDARERRGASSQDQIRLSFAATNSWNRHLPTPILGVNPSDSRSHFFLGGLSPTPPYSHGFLI